jgi:hypothetical protein
MKKTIKSILTLSAFILLLFSAGAAIEPSFSEARGNDWNALFDVPPFSEVTIENDTRSTALGAPINNELSGTDNDGYASAQNLAMLVGIKDCASRDSLLLLFALLALLSVYAVLRVARRRGWPLLKRKT